MKTTKKPVQLTPNLLRKIIEEEVGKFGDMKDVEKEAGKTKETDADEQADSLDKHIDYMKALKIEESRLTKRLARVQEATKRAARALIRKI